MSYDMSTMTIEDAGTQLEAMKVTYNYLTRILIS